jgi:outer membrane putative beta-barrel porin/alpha-amylase
MIAPVMRLAGTLGVVIVCSWLIPRAFGGPPLVTDDPETPGRGGWEINISHNIENTRDEFSMETPLIDVNYGLLENDQWKVEFPLVFLDSENDRGRWGIGDLEVGWKYRFFDEHDQGVMASIYPQVLTPTGSARFGLGGGRAEMLLPLEVGRHFHDEKILVYGEIGYNVVFDGSGEHSWIYGVAAEWRKSERLKLLFEVGGVAWETGSDPDFPFFNGGLKYDLTNRWTLIASAGRSFRDDYGGSPVLMTFLGLQWTTGNDPHR